MLKNKTMTARVKHYLWPKKFLVCSDFSQSNGKFVHYRSWEYPKQNLSKSTAKIKFYLMDLMQYFVYSKEATRLKKAHAKSKQQNMLYIWSNFTHISRGFWKLIRLLWSILHSMGYTSSNNMPIYTHLSFHVNSSLT
jgi:hypothetical protein